MKKTGLKIYPIHSKRNHPFTAKKTKHKDVKICDTNPIHWTNLSHIRLHRISVTKGTKKDSLNMRNEAILIEFLNAIGGSLDPPLPGRSERTWRAQPRRLRRFLRPGFSGCVNRRSKKFLLNRKRSHFVGVRGRAPTTINNSRLSPG